MRDYFSLINIAINIFYDPRENIKYYRNEKIAIKRKLVFIKQQV